MQKRSALPTLLDGFQKIRTFRNFQTLDSEVSGTRLLSLPPGPYREGRDQALGLPLDQEGDEAAEILAKRQRKDKVVDEEDTPEDGLYRGQKAYTSHIKKNQEVPKAMRMGPQRASGSTIRTVTIVDYQPDVCKDYKGMRRALQGAN